MNWLDSDNPSTVVRGASWRAGVWIVCVVLFFGAISIGLWSFGVFTSDVKGQGDATKEKNSSVNRIRAQEEYVQTYNAVLAADKKIDAMAAALALNPESQVAQVNLTGTINNCIDTVAHYNGLIDKYTSADFIPEGYPEQIDSLDPSTDCAASK